MGYDLSGCPVVNDFCALEIQVEDMQNDTNKTEKALVTVVIPVYNVEKYLDRCINSVVNQTYTNLEIILVDDGSPDRCPEMCDACAKRDARIKVVHKKNAGLGSARNTGIDHASGEYICFVDSDDYISVACVELLIKNLLDYDADVAICSLTMKEELLQKHTDTRIEVWDEKQALIQYIKCQKFTANMGGKLLDRKKIGNIRFDETVRMAEDKLFTFMMFDRSERIVFQDVAVYYYFQRQGSMLHSAFDERFYDVITVTELSYQSWIKKYPDLKGLFDKEKAITLARCIQTGLLDKTNNAIIIREQFIKKLKGYHYLEIHEYCNFRESCLFILEKHFLPLVCVYMRIKRFFRPLRK